MYMIILYAIIFICILSTNGNVALGTANESIRSLPIFQPSILDFGETPICIPSYSEFEIINRVKNKLEILSVETSSAFFLPITQNLTVDSFETASLQVVFLPYGLGSVEATLNVVTSFGNLTYYLKGFGKNNQYDIKPIFLEDAVGEIFNEQSITLFNPHDENINILEIFTTEPFINLVFENQSTLWTISPRMAKQVISFSISTEISSNQKGFVYIHTDLDKIVVPVVVDFNMNKLSLVKALEFGLVLATTEKKSIDLVVVNDARRSILLHGIRTYPPDPNMKIDMISKYTLIPTATIMKIATLTYTSTYSGKFNGSVVIFTNESKHFGAKDVFTYRGEVYTGSVSFDRSQTVFPIGFSNPDRNFPTIKRKISFKNLFPIPFKITNVGLTNCIGMFQLRENIVGVFLNTNESSASVQISLIPTALEAVYNHQRDFLPKTCWLEVSTNISSQRIPLHIMKGNLIFDFLEGNLLGWHTSRKMEKGIAQSFYLVDKGQIEAANPPDWRFVVVNPNPVPIKLSFQNSTEIDKICLLAIWSVGYNARSESLKLSRKIPLTSAAICLNFDPDDLNNITNFELELNPGFYYLFGASLRVTSISNSALVQISTNYEYISINISYAKIHTHLDLQILQNVGTDSNPFLPITILDLNYSSSVYHNLHMLIPSHSPWQAIEKTKLYGDLKFVFVRNKTFPNFDYPLIYDLYESPRDSLEQLGILLGQLDHTINRPPIAKFEQQRVIDKIVNGFRVHDPNISEQFHTIQIRFDEAMYQIALPGRNSHDKVIQGSHEVSIEVVVHSTKKYQMFLELNNPFPWETLYYFYTPEQRTAIARIFQEEDFRPCPTDELMEISYSCISCSNLNHFLRSANLRKHESDIIFSEGDNENRPCNLPNLPLDSLESKSHVSLKQNQTIYFGPIEVSNNTANILLSKPFLIFNNVTGWTKLNLEFTPYVTNVSVTWTKAAFNQDNNPFVRLSINNTGSRPIVITDVDFDGYGCKTQTFTGRWNIFRTEPTKQMLVNGFCEHLPMKIERLSSNQLDILLNLGCSARLSGGLSVLVTESADDDMLLKFDTYLIGEQTKDFSCFKDGISRTKTSLLLIVILCLILLIFSIWGFAQKFLHYFSMQQLKNPMLAGKKLTSSSLIRSKLKVLNNRQNFEKKLSIVLADIKVNDDCSRPQIIEEVRRKINSVQNRKDSILSLIQDRATKDDVHVLNLTRSDYDNIDGSNYNFDAIKSAAPNLIGLKEPTELLDVIEHEYYHMTYDDDDIVDSPIFEYNGELDTFYIPSLGRLSHQVRQEVDDLDIDPVLNPSRAIQVQHKVDLTMKGIIEVQDDDDVFLEYDHNCEDIVMGVISDDEESIKSAENNYDGTNVWEQMNNLSPNDTQSTFFGKDNFFANLGEIDSNLLLELEENPLQNIH